MRKPFLLTVLAVGLSFSPQPAQGFKLGQIVKWAAGLYLTVASLFCEAKNIAAPSLAYEDTPCYRVDQKFSSSVLKLEEQRECYNSWNRANNLLKEVRKCLEKDAGWCPYNSKVMLVLSERLKEIPRLYEDEIRERVLKNYLRYGRADL